VLVHSEDVFQSRWLVEQLVTVPLPLLPQRRRLPEEAPSFWHKGFGIVTKSDNDLELSAVPR